MKFKSDKQRKKVMAILTTRGLVYVTPQIISKNKNKSYSELKKKGIILNPKNPNNEKTEVISLSEVRQLNEQKGFHFFSPDTTRFFRSRYPETAIKKGDTAYFITSEQFVSSEGESSPRKFTIRKANLKTGDVNTAGEFQGYSSRSKAKTELMKMIPTKKLKDSDKDGVPDKFDCCPKNPNKQGKLHDVAVKLLRKREQKLENKRIEQTKKLEHVRERLKEQASVQQQKLAKVQQRQAIINEIDSEKQQIKNLKQANLQARKQIFAQSPTGKAVKLSKSAIQKTQIFLKKPSTKKALKSFDRLIRGK